MFCRRILNTGEGSFLQIRETLRKKFKLPIPGRESQKPWTLADHRLAFTGFLEFVQMNLAGQTAIRVDAAWGTQAQALAGFGDFVLPDHVVREDEMAQMLPLIAGMVGHESPPDMTNEMAESPFDLAD
ncbi:MAG TPA: nodulation protein NodH, partial [Roseibacterium sp.]|nr:nodulation protein NodH [Roseibacterium sp.]